MLMVEVVFRFEKLGRNGREVYLLPGAGVEMEDMPSQPAAVEEMLEIAAEVG